MPQIQLNGIADRVGCVVLVAGLSLVLKMAIPLHYVVFHNHEQIMVTYV